MSEGAWLEYQADRHVDHLRRVVIPAAEHRAMIEHELALMGKPDRAPRPAPLRWIGDRLIRIGERLREGAAPSQPLGAGR
jgi:hypothetical protein